MKRIKENLGKYFVFILILGINIQCEKYETELEKRVDDNIGDLKNAITNQILVYPGDDLRYIISTAANSTEIYITQGVYELTDYIEVSNKSDIIIRGEGSSTVLNFNIDHNSCGFYLFDNLNGLTIKDLKISNISSDTTLKFEGIGSSEETINRNISIKGIVVEGASNGIYLGGSSSNYIWENISICNNKIYNTYGYISGWGYGIRCGWANNILVADNYLEKTTRHAIYIPGGDIGIKVVNNLILDHGYSTYKNTMHWNLSALTLARTNGVTAESNIILNTYTNVGLSIEEDEIEGRSIYDVTLINNKIIGAKVGVWINTGEDHILLGNIIYNCSLIDILLNNNSNHHIPNPDLENYQYLSQTSKNLFLLKDDLLRKVEPYSWICESSPINWFNTEAMVAKSENGIDKIYIVQNGVLHEVNSNDWSYRYSSPIWGGTQAITTNNDKLYIIQNNILHKVNISNFTYTYSNTNWYNTQWIGSWGNSIYILQNNILHQVNPQNLNYEILEYTR